MATDRWQQSIEDQLRELRADVGELKAEILGPLIGVGRLPVRDRLHDLEKDRFAAELARQYLERAKEIRDTSKHRWIGWAVTLVVGIGAAALGKFA